MTWNFRQTIRQQLYVDASFAGVEAGTEAKPFRTISAALRAAGEGCLVRVAPGLYRENVTLKRGVGVVTSPVGAAIIHGGANLTGGRPTVLGADDALLEGFVVTGGYSGVRCDATSPTISRNIVRGNYGTAGIVCLRGSRAALVNNTVLGHVGKPGIGVYIEGAVPVLRNNIIAFNNFGLSPYQVTPDSDYNAFWGNRLNVAYQQPPGPHALGFDPQFRSAHWDDYRLASGSPCAGTGDPNPAYQATPTPTVDRGAFAGDAGYPVSPSAQEYFVESVLHALPMADGTLALCGTSRFTSNPVFWFDSTGRGTAGEADARRAIAEAVPVLTAGRHTAAFRDDPSPPARPSEVVTVTFAPTPQPNLAYRQGSGPNGEDPNGQIEARGAAITGGRLSLDTSATAGFAGDPGAVDRLRRRLGLVAGLIDGYRGQGVMALGDDWRVTGFDPVELEAFRLLYQYPPGTTWTALAHDRKLLPNAQHPFPRIDAIQRFNAMGALAPTTQAKAGEAVVLTGARLTLRMVTETRVTTRLAPPEVCFGSTVVVPNLADLPGQPGEPARALKVYVPPTATSGLVFVRAHGLESNPVWLDIV